MNAHDVSIHNLSTYLNSIITEFYNNNLQPYYDALCEDVLWIGPHTGQIIQGRDNLINAFEQEKGEIKYYLGMINTQTIRLSANSANTISVFERTALYPENGPLTFELLYHLAWIKEDVWKMRVINIFMQTPKYYKGNMFPVKPTGVIFPKSDVNEEPLQFKETGTGSTLFIAPSRIQWAESKERHSVLHMDDKKIVVSVELNRLSVLLGKTHLRCHSCYIINPENVTSIQRFSVTLTGNITIPIPEKKYTEIKRKLTEFFDNTKRN